MARSMHRSEGTYTCVSALVVLGTPLLVRTSPVDLGADIIAMGLALLVVTGVITDVRLLYSQGRRRRSAASWLLLAARWLVVCALAIASAFPVVTDAFGPDPTSEHAGM